MTSCIFCIDTLTRGSHGIPSERVLKEYHNWWLVLQREDKLLTTKQAAGLLISKQHLEDVSSATEAAAQELLSVIKESAELLCKHVGTTYSGQETVGFNQGPDAGQTVKHAHVHILPVSEEDPAELKVRGGIGGAFEALREKRLGPIS